MRTWLPRRGVNRIVTVAAISVWCFAGLLRNAGAGGQDSPAVGRSGLGSNAGTATTPSLPPFWPESYLNPDQSARYREALERSQVEMKAIDAKLQVARQELDDAMLAEQYDEGLVRKKAMEVGALEAERTVLSSRALAEIRSTLTLEQIRGLRGRYFVRVQKLTPEQLEAKREEIRTDLERRVAADHEARRAQLLARLHAQLDELRKQQAEGKISDYDRSRISRIESMIKHMESGEAPEPEPDSHHDAADVKPKPPDSTR